MMPRFLALGLAVAFLAPLAGAQQGAGKSPEVLAGFPVASIQRFIDGLVGIGEVHQALQSGDVVLLTTSSGSADERWHGTMNAGALRMEKGNVAGPTHTLKVDRNALLSIVNAYDMPNTAKLAVKQQYMVAESERAAVRAAIGAIARTPLDERLPTYDPRAGDRITMAGCTGTLEPRKTAYKVELCGDTFDVSTLGGLTAKYPASHLGFGLRDYSLIDLAGSYIQFTPVETTKIVTLPELFAYHQRDICEMTNLRYCIELRSKVVSG